MYQFLTCGRGHVNLNIMYILRQIAHYVATCASGASTNWIPSHHFDILIHMFVVLYT